MKRLILFAAISAAIPGGVSAHPQYGAVLTNMVEALSAPRATLQVSFTNQLAVCSASETNSAHKANIDLVYAIALADLSAEELSGSILLPKATSICSNLLQSAELPRTAWQRGAAGIVLTGIYLFEGKREAARCLSTNVLSSTACNLDHGEDTVLWNAIARHFEVEGLSVCDSLRCFSAIACLLNDGMSDVSAYTNCLPSSICERIGQLANE